MRGIIAARTGRLYTGIVAKPERAEANRAVAIASEHREPPPAKYVAPRWIAADAREIDRVAPGEFDFIFMSVSPTGDGEPYERLVERLGAATAKCCAVLKSDRFACVVISGEARDDEGHLRPFQSDVNKAFDAAGLWLHNDLVLMTGAGVAIGRMLDFCKGDDKRATKALEADPGLSRA